MSLDKAIKHGKEKREPFRKAKAHTAGCRNHGHCEWCRSNRTAQDAKERSRADAKLREHEKEAEE